MHTIFEDQEHQAVTSISILFTFIFLHFLHYSTNLPILNNCEFPISLFKHTVYVSYWIDAFSLLICALLWTVYRKDFGLTLGIERLFAGTRPKMYCTICEWRLFGVSHRAMRRLLSLYCPELIKAASPREILLLPRGIRLFKRLRFIAYLLPLYIFCKWYKLRCAR